MAIQNDSQYPVLTQLINDVQDIKEEGITLLGDEEQRKASEIARQEAETARQQRISELQAIDAVMLNSQLKDVEVQVGAKVSGVHYHGLEMVTGLTEKLSSISDMISDLYSKISSTPPVQIDIVSVDAIADITIQNGTSINSILPVKAWVTFSNNTRAQKNITWGSGVIINDTEIEDTYIFEGSVEDTTLKATVKIIVEMPNVTPVDPNVIISDNFDRIDNLTSLGGSWIVENDTVWGIENNRASVITDGAVGSNVAVVETNKSDVSIEVDCLYDASISVYNGGIAFRYTNNSNYYHTVVAGNTLEVRKFVNSVSTVIGSYGTTQINGHTYNFKVILEGDNITVLLDGEQRIVVTDSFNNTATKHGLRAYTSGTTKTYFDNFKVADIEVVVTPPQEQTYDVISNGAVGNGITENALNKFSTTLPNYIKPDNIVAMSATTYRALTADVNRKPSQAFVGDGQIKILNFQVSWETKAAYPQGTVFAKDMNDKVIMAMNLPNEGIPFNAQQKQQRGGSYSYPVLRSDIVSLVPWGQVFLKTGTAFATGNYINIENMTILVYRDSTQKWEILSTSKNGENSIMGRWVDVNFSEDGTMLSPKNATYTATANGIRLLLDNADAGYGFHFWIYRNDKFRFGVVPTDIKYIITYADITAETTAGANCLTADIGCDAYTGINGAGSIYEVGVGGFINTSTTKKRCYFTNLGYNNYFTYCNQALIDSLT